MLILGFWWVPIRQLDTDRLCIRTVDHVDWEQQFERAYMQYSIHLSRLMLNKNVKDEYIWSLDLDPGLIFEWCKVFVDFQCQTLRLVTCVQTHNLRPTTSLDPYPWNGSLIMMLEEMSFEINNFLNKNSETSKRSLNIFNCNCKISVIIILSL